MTYGKRRRPVREGAPPPHMGAPLFVPSGGRPLGVDYFARSKSILLYARSFESRCVESIWRIVPDFERMTSDCVVAVSAR